MADSKLRDLSTDFAVKGQLGATFSSHSLQFEFEADQTLLTTLLKGIKI